MRKSLFLSLFGLFLLLSFSSCEYPNLEDGLYVEIQTPKGMILGKLEMNQAPLTVANFVALAEGDMPNTAREPGVPFFDGLTFHRVVPNFVIQGGDPQGNGQGSPGYFFRNEVSPDLPHDRAGTFSMANAGPNTNGSQFFITHRATPNLNGGYSVFGYVIEGQEVVDAIEIGDTMDKVKIIRKGSQAKTFDAVAVFTENK